MTATACIPKRYAIRFAITRKVGLEEAKLLYRQPGSQSLLTSGSKLGEEYYEFAVPIIRLQLARAVVRLAFTLNGSGVAA